MAKQKVLSTHVNPSVLEQFAGLAAYHGLSQSALLRRLIDTVLAANPPQASPTLSVLPTPAPQKLTVRLRPGDGALLARRAAARGVRTSTYVTLLLRAHLRANPPLPESELAALKDAAGAISDVLRRLDKLVRWTREGNDITSEFANDLPEVIHGVRAVRQYCSQLIETNLISWESGDA
jgi:hypothetical protein